MDYVLDSVEAVLILGGNRLYDLKTARPYNPADSFFGGPAFTKQQINLAQFITTHVSQLFEQQRLGERIADLEAERRLARLQDDFIAMVSHELKTPLGFIKGYTTTLLRTDTKWDHETRQDFLEIIDDEADRLSELISNLLDSYRLKSGSAEFKLVPVPLAAFFKNILDRLRKKDINLDIAVYPHQ